MFAFFGGWRAVGREGPSAQQVWQFGAMWEWKHTCLCVEVNTGSMPMCLSCCWRWRACPWPCTRLQPACTLALRTHAQVVELLLEMANKAEMAKLKMESTSDIQELAESGFKVGMPSMVGQQPFVLRSPPVHDAPLVALGSRRRTHRVAEHVGMTGHGLPRPLRRSPCAHATCFSRLAQTPQTARPSTARHCSKRAPRARASALSRRRGRSCWRSTGACATSARGCVRRCGWWTTWWVAEGT